MVEDEYVIGAEAESEAGEAEVLGAEAEAEAGAGVGAGPGAGVGAGAEEQVVAVVEAGYLGPGIVLEVENGVVEEAEHVVGAAHMAEPAADLELLAVAQPAYGFVGTVDNFAVDTGRIVGIAADKGHIQDIADNIVDIEVVVDGTTALP